MGNEEAADFVERYRGRRDLHVSCAEALTLEAQERWKALHDEVGVGVGVWGGRGWSGVGVWGTVWEVVGVCMWVCRSGKRCALRTPQRPALLACRAKPRRQRS